MSESTELLRQENVTSVADSFRQGWKEAMRGETLPIELLWEENDDELVASMVVLSVRAHLSSSVQKD